MQKITEEIYRRIDNNLYNQETDNWWQPNSALHLLKTTVNPLRVEYSLKVLFDGLRMNPIGKLALEIGCGGGILCEEIARMGFTSTGIDPSEQSLNIAINHAKISGLKINYEKGEGEFLPYKNNFFDVVFCCDVLEHVRDLPKVISEISRVLKPGGVFIYDTINRTLLSKLVVIKISQDWKRWAFMPKNLHVWEMFIKPEELIFLLEQNNFDWKEQGGASPNVSFTKLLKLLRRRAKGKLTYKELGEKFSLMESGDTGIFYMGHAIKKTI